MSYPPSLTRRLRPSRVRPSVAALKRVVALLSGRQAMHGQEAVTDAVFDAPDALGWAYQYWNTEEKDRVFTKVRTQRAKIEGADIIPATQLYTEPYMVKFLVQNSLGATWMGMNPELAAGRWLGVLRPRRRPRAGRCRSPSPRSHSSTRPSARATSCSKPSTCSGGCTRRRA